MAQNVELECHIFSCCLCLDALKEPVTTTCGHSYCRECIKGHWDVEEEERRIYSCPQCRKTFTPRPALERSTMLAALMESLEKAAPQRVPADHHYAGAGDVACDVCTGRRMKALKFCLVCRASFCESHLQPHRQSLAFQRHKLVEPTQAIQEGICDHHKGMMELLNRAEQLCSCPYCSVEEHQERRNLACYERDYQPEIIRKAIQDRIEEREKDLHELQYELRTIDSSVCHLGKEQNDMFIQLEKLLKKQFSEAEDQLRSRRIAEASRVLELQKKIDKEIAELKKKLAWMDSTDLTGFSTEFLINFLESTLSLSPDSYSLEIHPKQYFEDLRKDFSEFRDTVQKALMGTRTTMSKAASDMDVSEPEPRTREDFLRYSRELTLDPNTAHQDLHLSAGNRSVFNSDCEQSEDHIDRFISWEQVMSSQSLTGRCYWEVEWRHYAGVAVSYWNVNRAGRSKKCGFGSDDMSWCLYHLKNGYWFRHNNTKTIVAGPVTGRVGVYLDHSAGLLSYYSIGDTMERLVTVQTTFTEPLYAGIFTTLASVKLCTLNS